MRINLQNRISTDFYGFQQLIDVYHRCKSEKNKTITIDFTELEWIDGNMCAFFGAVIYKLRAENKLVFKATGSENFREQFDFLFTNGFLTDGSNVPCTDIRKTTVPLKSYSTNQKDEYCGYLKTQLMQHRGMNKVLSQELKTQITDDLIEIIANIDLHANSNAPFFLCGQYFPKQGHLVFTIVDLGVGFLPAIKIKTKGNISESIKAIRWALAGNTTKTDCSGGIGLKNIKLYCENEGGILQIISGDAFYGSDLVTTMWKGHRQLTQQFVGTTINLYFKC
jgi:hypothetical protein